MPGLIGLVGSPFERSAAQAAAASICHFESYVTRRESPLEGVQIAQVWRRAEETDGCWHAGDESGPRIYVNGTVIEPGPRPRVLAAREILDRWLDGTIDPAALDGSFVIAVVDPQNRELVVFNDRLGTLPCYYRAGRDSFCFAPEAKALFAAGGTAPRYSPTGLTTFLTLGYCLGDTTLFESIAFLEPASRITVDLSSGRHAVTRYWSIEYEPAAEFRSRRRAEEALYESILAGHRTVFADDGEAYDLLLSGGWDSRGMLAAARALGRLPRRSMAWGLREDIPLSDPRLARELAELYGLDHRFVSYDTDSFAENAMEWARMTELNTDNFGWYGEGTSILLNEYATGADFVLAGDESWGFGGHVRNRQEVMAACFMPSPLPSAVAKCLAPKLAREANERYSAEIDKVLRACDARNPVDRKDFLYLHGRVARFIFSLGYYKEFAVEVRRPFLGTQVLDVVRRVPARLRYGKNLYISTLIRFFPELLRVNKRSADSLPNWRADLRSKPGVCEVFADLVSSRTLSDTSFAEALSLPYVEAIARDFSSEVHDEKKGGNDQSANRGAFVQLLKQRITAYDDVRLVLRLREPSRRGFKNFDLLRRIALLTLLDRNLPGMSRPEASG